MDKPKNIILGLTRTIATGNICKVIDCLQDQDCSVTVVLTEAAKKAAKIAILEKLTGNRVYCGLFDGPQSWDVEHISLAQKADLVLIAPLDKATVNKIACGICDDLLTCVVCATKAPVFIALETNENIYKNKITQGNIAKLKTLGYRFITPKNKKLTYVDVGVCCLTEVAELIK